MRNAMHYMLNFDDHVYDQPNYQMVLDIQTSGSW